MMVSCYADTSVSQGFASPWLQPVKAEATRIGRQLAGDHQARREFERNVEAIRRALESPVARQARGMAVFAAMGRGFFLALTGSEPYENRLVVAEEPYVVPLFEADFRQRAYLAVLADTHRARLYAAGPGGSRVLDEIDEAVLRKQHAAGKPWATTERHRRDRTREFHQELVQRVEEAWSEHPYQGIILLGQHELLEQVRNLLPARLSSQVVHEAPHAWTEDQAEIDEGVKAVLETSLQAEEHRVLVELDRRIREATAVAAGPQEVIDALKDGQVAALILGPDPGAAASHCTGCRALFAVSHAACPYCHAPCRTGNLWQAILSFAVPHGIWVHRVEPSASLAAHGGIAALLARDQPQGAQATTLPR
jgi:peptide subunit release factor 1 (eRF1)